MHRATMTVSSNNSQIIVGEKFLFSPGMPTYFTVGKWFQIYCYIEFFFYLFIHYTKHSVQDH